MKSYFFAVTSAVVALAGCGTKAESNRPGIQQRSANEDRVIDDPLLGLRSHAVQDHPGEEHSADLALAGSSIQLPNAKPQRVSPFQAEGTFVASGWMGDAEDPSGPLKHEVCTIGANSAPTCDKWVYAAPQGSERTWVAVAYQGPTANNWGKAKGVDFSGGGYTRLTFMARGEKGGEVLLVKSGGCTSPGARYPASYEATIGTIALDSTWKQVEMPLEFADLSNTACILSFTINRAMAPDGCTFYLDDIALRGPKGD